MKPSYGDDLLDQVWAWGYDKTPSADIEASLHLSPGSLAAWLREDGKRSLAYKTGRDQRDESDTLEVEAGLHKAAIGYTVEKDVMSKAGGVVTLTEDVPPNAAAALKWAERRDKPRWGEDTKQDKALMAVERLTVINNYLTQATPVSPFKEIPDGE